MSGWWRGMRQCAIDDSHCVWLPLDCVDLVTSRCIHPSWWASALAEGECSPVNQQNSFTQHIGAKTCFKCMDLYAKMAQTNLN
jgi:hypothetical protein